MYQEKHGDSDSDHTFDSLVHLEGLQDLLDRARVLHQAHQLEESEDFDHLVHAWQLEDLAKVADITLILIHLDVYWNGMQERKSRKNQVRR